MLNRHSEFTFGDFLLTYWLDEAGHMSMTLIPARLAGRVAEKPYNPESLAQIHAEGDPLPNGYGNG